MLTAHTFLSQAVVFLTGAWIAGLWQGAVLMLMAFALLRLMPRASASLRHALLVSLFVLAAALPWIHMQGATSATAAQHGVSISPWIAAAVAALWLAAAAFRAVQLAIAWRHLRQVRSNAVPLLLDEQQLSAAGPAKTLLFVSSDVEAPMVLGFWQPRLLLPEWMAPRLSPEELRQITLHECEHLRRHDDWMNLLLQIVLMLFPLHPGLAWLHRHIRIQRELACDAAVVAWTAEPIAYATCLTRLAEQRMQRTHLRLALAAWERKSELVQRVHALLKQPAAWSRRQSGLAAATVVTLLCAASVAMLHVPQFVSVASTAPAAFAAEPSVAIARQPSSLRLSDATTGVRMVPASMVVHGPSSTLTEHRIRPKHSVRKGILTSSKAPRRQQQIGSPHFVRTSTFNSDRAELSNIVADESTPPARFVTTDFLPTYVAVPTSAGWLFIQL